MLIKEVKENYEAIIKGKEKHIKELEGYILKKDAEIKQLQEGVETLTKDQCDEILKIKETHKSLVEKLKFEIKELKTEFKGEF